MNVQIINHSTIGRSVPRKRFHVKLAFHSEARIPFPFAYYMSFSFSTPPHSHCFDHNKSCNSWRVELKLNCNLAKCVNHKKATLSHCLHNVFTYRCQLILHMLLTMSFSVSLNAIHSPRCNLKYIALKSPYAVSYLHTHRHIKRLNALWESVKRNGFGAVIDAIVESLSTLNSYFICYMLFREWQQHQQQ